MKFYKLRIKPEELGVVAQESKMIGPYNVTWPNSFQKTIFNGRLHQTIFPEGFTLKPRAKFTDLASFAMVSYPWLVVSERLHTLIRTFNIPNGKIAPIKLVKGKNERSYYAFCTYDVNYQCIDYKKSVFTLYDHEAMSRAAIQIDDQEKYFEVKNSISNNFLLECNAPVFNFSGIKFDLIRGARGFKHVFYLVSEHLVQAIQKAKMTGIEFEDTSLYYS